MDSSRIPPLQKPRGDKPHGAGSLWRTAAGAAKTIGDKGVSWCRDHLLLTTVLVSISLMMAVFFLNRTDPEAADAEGSRPGSRFDAQALPGIPENAPLSNVIPDGPTAGPSPELLTFDAPIGRAQYSQTLSSGDRSEGGDSLEGPALPSYASRVSLNKSGQGCVWLTGIIEPVEPEAAVIQDASRVHELTMPARH